MWPFGLASRNLPVHSKAISHPKATSSENIDKKHGTWEPGRGRIGSMGGAGRGANLDLDFNDLVDLFVDCTRVQYSTVPHCRV